MKTQSKIALTYFTGSLSIILLFGIAVYYFSTRYSFTDFYKRLEIRAILTARSHSDNVRERIEAFNEIRNLHLEKLPEEKDYLFEIKGDSIVSPEAVNLGLPADFFPRLLSTGTANHQNGNTFYTGVRIEGGETDYAVVVSANNYYNTHHLVYLRNLLFFAIPLASLLALLVAIIFSRMVLSPVRLITDRVKEISSENMNLRLPSSGTKDETGELITTFNEMLDRLQTSFETQNNFISNASHELSTPLTSIIGEAEVALIKERAVSDYKDSLRAILAEAERLEHITRSLLFLAQTGFDGKKQKMSIVRTDQLLWDVKETIDKINPHNKILIDLNLIPDNPEKLKISGNPQLLHLALTNVVSNACKYSSNKPVKLSIGTAETSVLIVVRDQGIGIPSDELKYIYDPFFRGSNTRNFEGYGIGLPLTRNIIRLHRGSITVHSQENSGTTVEISFPLAILS